MQNTTLFRAAVLQLQVELGNMMIFYRYHDKLCHNMLLYPAIEDQIHLTLNSKYSKPKVRLPFKTSPNLMGHVLQ